MSELPIPYEITVAQDMVTDPEATSPLRHQWQSKESGKAWTNIQGATGSTYTTNDFVRNQSIRLTQSTNDGAVGESNELYVTNILSDNLELGQKPGRPIELPDAPTDDGSFTAIGGGIGANDTIVFYQGDGDGYYVDDYDGRVKSYSVPVGGPWDISWQSPWGGAAHTQDGKYIVLMPGNHGSPQIIRSPGATFDPDDRPGQTISAGLPNYGTYGQDYYGSYTGYFGGCTGSNIKPTRFYGTPFDHDKVLWVDTDQSLPQGNAQYGFININMNGSTGDLSEPRKWGMGALAGNGKIYCPPSRYSTREMLIIDTNNDTAEIGPYLDETRNPGKYNLYSSGVMGKDGCLYFLSHQAHSCWKLDPSDDSLTKFGDGDRPGNNGSQSSEKIVGFGQASLYPDGHIYCKMPENGKQYLVQLDTDNLTWKTWELNSSASRGMTRIFLDYDANLYWTPSPTALRTVDVWNRGYGRGPWPMPGVPGGMLDPLLPFFNHSRGA